MWLTSNLNYTHSPWMRMCHTPGRSSHNLSAWEISSAGGPDTRNDSRAGTHRTCVTDRQGKRAHVIYVSHKYSRCLLCDHDDDDEASAGHMMDDDKRQL